MTEDVATTIADPANWTLVRKHSLFQGITDEELASILSYFKFVQLRSNYVVMQEGHASDELYLVLEGTLEVIKRSDGGQDDDMTRNTGDRFTIARVSGGDTIGELSLIMGTPRSATVKTVTPAALLSLNRASQQKLESDFPGASNIFMKNLLGSVGTRLVQTSSNQVQALKVELEKSLRASRSNLFFSYVIGLLCVYNLTINVITNLSMDNSKASLISAGIIVIFGVVLTLMIRQSQLPIRIFGLTTAGWKPAVRESMIWTVIIVTALIVTKWILITNVDRYAHLPLFDFNPLGERALVINFIVYGLHSPIQEFIARGVLQGSLQHFFTGRNVTFRAILVSNALFAATHVHLLGGALAVLVFLPGLFWGWLYSRNQNLIGVSISHIIIGWIALFLLNLESLF